MSTVPITAAAIRRFLQAMIDRRRHLLKASGEDSPAGGIALTELNVLQTVYIALFSEPYRGG